ncbi:MAG: HU family DNA-binding protein [Porphyromonas sp.]|nr:HU family DNA-binding protein [Porphyromonas sp.]MDO4695644.1 HU family DNA-binding protein [Porphyromonas sp.]MDO4771627.1 HU family DNA-binding protein [Porphyromonas sp.]
MWGTENVKGFFCTLRKVLLYLKHLKYFRMNKTEFISAVAEKAGVTKVDTKAVVDAMVSVVAEQMKKGEKIAILGFGTFSVAERAKREGFNPRTKEKIKIPARKVVKFKPGSDLDITKKK